MSTAIFAAPRRGKRMVFALALVAMAATCNRSQDRKQEKPPPLGVSRSGITVASARPGLSFPWEGERSYVINRIPGRTPDLLFYNPATGALALRVVLAEWDDRLPDRLSLAYDSQAPDPQARFKLDWDRALTVSDGGATVVVEDRWLRPIAFTDVDG